MERRASYRNARRLSCELLIEGHRSAGQLRDLSTKGLFVETSARPPVNSVVEVIFPPEGARPQIRVEAGVARRREVPPRLQASSHPGIGLELLGPRPAFERWILRPSRPSLAESAHADFAPDGLADLLLCSNEPIRLD